MHPRCIADKCLKVTRGFLRRSNHWCRNTQQDAQLVVIVFIGKHAFLIGNHIRLTFWNPQWWNSEKEHVFVLRIINFQSPIMISPRGAHLDDNAMEKSKACHVWNKECKNQKAPSLWTSLWTSLWPSLWTSVSQHSDSLWKTSYFTAAEPWQPWFWFFTPAGRAMRPSSPIESEEMEFLVNLHDPVRFC